MKNLAQLNQAEQAALDAVLSAQRDYKKMAYRWWLHHAPEFFVTVALAKRLSKSFDGVFLDTTISKIKEHFEHWEHEDKKNVRFDMVVFSKTDGYPKFIFEVKKLHGGSIVKDAIKLKNIEKRASRYILVYGDKKSSLETKFKEINEEINKEVKSTIVYFDGYVEKDKDGNIWGFCLFKIT